MTKALICTDGSPTSIDAVCRGASLLSRPRSMTVLCVVDLRSEVVAGGAGLIGAEPVAIPLPAPDVSAEIDHRLVDLAEEAAARTVAALPESDGPVETMVVRGDPAGEICRAARDGRYDVVVVGSHGWGLVRRMFAGSVRDHVLQHAPCAVLTVRLQ